MGVFLQSAPRMWILLLLLLKLEPSMSAENPNCEKEEAYYKDLLNKMGLFCEGNLNDTREQHNETLNRLKVEHLEELEKMTRSNDLLIYHINYTLNGVMARNEKIIEENIDLYARNDKVIGENMDLKARIEELTRMLSSSTTISSTIVDYGTTSNDETTDTKDSPADQSNYTYSNVDGYDDFVDCGPDCKPLGAINISDRQECLDICEKTEECCSAAWVPGERCFHFSSSNIVAENCTYPECDLYGKDSSLVLLIGGSNNVMVNWSPHPQCTPNITFERLPEDLGIRSRAAVLWDTIYTCGGLLQEKNCYAANVTGGSWKRVDNLNEERYEHTLTKVEDKLVVTGGFIEYSMPPNLSSTVEIYSEGSGWEVASWRLLQPDAFHCALETYESELLVVSGRSNLTGMSIAKYNIHNGAADHLAPPADAIGGASICTGDMTWNEFYIAKFSEQRYRYFFWQFLLDSEEWKRLPDLPLGAIIRMALVGGDLTVFGKMGFFVLKNDTWVPSSHQQQHEDEHEKGCEYDFDDGDVVVLSN